MKVLTNSAMRLIALSRQIQVHSLMLEFLYPKQHDGKQIIESSEGN